MYPSPSQNYPTLLGDAIVIAGGVLLVSLTFNTYRYSHFTSASHVHAQLSSAEANARVADAQSRVNRRPDDFDAWADLAIAYYQKGPDQYVDGLNALDKARDLGSTEESLFYYAGVMDQGLGLPDYAVSELTKYLRHHPNDYETLVRLGNLHYSEKKFDEAQQYYKAALRQWPKDPTVWFNYALVCKEKSQFSEALTALERSRQLAGKWPEGGSYQEGEILRLQGSNDAAIQAYKEELAQRPDFVPALEALEVAAKHKGDLKEARSWHKRISDLKHANLVIAK